jgi:hypothetical protein
MTSTSPSLFTKTRRLGLHAARANLPGFTAAEAGLSTIKRTFAMMYSLIVFAYACFFRPIGKHSGSQQDRLDSVRGIPECSEIYYLIALPPQFYETQAQGWCPLHFMTGHIPHPHTLQSTMLLGRVSSRAGTLSFGYALLTFAT